MLRGQILPRMQADGHHLIAVSSPRAMQSKSLTALNLALTMAADLDTSVLLLDADLSGRGLQQLLGLGGQPGLIEHLLHGARLPGLLINPGIDRFLVLPAGAEPVGNSSELLATKALQRLVQEMKQRYPDRVIVVDLPPLLDTADALAFLPWADTTLFVAEAQHSRIRDLEAAAELLAPFNLIGTVLSPAPLDPPTARKGWSERTMRTAPLCHALGAASGSWASVPQLSMLLAQRAHEDRPVEFEFRTRVDWDRQVFG
jgi:Mrp family chromosome partitioning ATPase